MWTGAPNSIHAVSGQAGDFKIPSNVTDAMQRVKSAGEMFFHIYSELYVRLLKPILPMPVK